MEKKWVFKLSSSQLEKSRLIELFQELRWETLDLSLGFLLRIMGTASSRAYVSLAETC
jgi:hypothetical protein